ncbi:MAG: PDZ domain-containing protein, partial [Planctomycetes bacterium]|nr:PDZ domain-containing protein [Planctomycetota bacterium]
MPSRTLVLLLLPVMVAAAETPPLFPVGAPSPYPAPRETFEEVQRLILDNYYSPTIDEETLWWAATRGMLRQVSPPDDPERATLWPPQSYERVADSLRGVTHASGVQSSWNAADGSLTVTSVEPGSPAAGLLRPWDRILRIDGQPLAGLDVATIDRRLRGEAGEQVALTVVRDVEVLDITLEFREYASPKLEVQRVGDDVLYTRLLGMSLGSAETLGATLRQLLPADGAPLALVLDLRDNGGGVFVEGLRIAELFLARNDIIVRSVRRREGVQNYVSANDMPLPARVVVLVNATTASAAEMLTAALRAHGIASVVGEPSFGKASMEETFTLGNGYRVK